MVNVVCLISGITTNDRISWQFLSFNYLSNNTIYNISFLFMRSMRKEHLWKVPKCLCFCLKTKLQPTEQGFSHRPGNVWTAEFPIFNVFTLMHQIWAWHRQCCGQGQWAIPQHQKLWKLEIGGSLHQYKKLIENGIQSLF